MELRNSPVQKASSPWLLGLSAPASPVVPFRAGCFGKNPKGLKSQRFSSSLEPNVSSGAGSLSELHGTAAWYPPPSPQG